MSTRQSLSLPRSAGARTLKLQLEKAVQDYRNELDLWPPIEFDDPQYEAKILSNMELARARRNNDLLEQYFELGKHLNFHQDDIDFNKEDHVIGHFLYSYFEEENYPAISYLCDASISSLSRISSRDRVTILYSRQPQHSFSPILGNNDDPELDFDGPLINILAPQRSPGAGELWKPEDNRSYATIEQIVNSAVDLDEPYFEPRLDPTTTREFTPYFLTANYTQFDRHAESATPSGSASRNRSPSDRTDRPEKRARNW